MTVREFTASEMPEELVVWLQATHGDKVTAADFFGSGRKALVVRDTEGKPVMFVRLSQALRVDIQFDPEVTPLRTAKAMKALNEIVSEQEAVGGVREFLFDSVAAPLIACIKRLGFRAEPDTFSKRLEGR